jgi:hypothetical protein
MKSILRSVLAVLLGALAAGLLIFTVELLGTKLFPFPPGTDDPRIPFSGRAGAIKSLQANGAERLILIEVRDWWSDSLIHTDLHYDLASTVLNAQGQELGSSAVTGHDELGSASAPSAVTL